MKTILILALLILSLSAEEIGIFNISIREGLSFIDKGDINSGMNLLRRGINCHWIDGKLVNVKLQEEIVELEKHEVDKIKKSAYLVYLAVFEMTNKDIDFPKALNFLNKAEELNKILPEIYNTRGVIYYINAKFNLALADYSRAIELNSRYIDALKNRSDVYRKMGKSDLAVKDYVMYQDLLNTLYYSNQ